MLIIKTKSNISFGQYGMDKSVIQYFATHLNCLIRICRIIIYSNILTSYPSKLTVSKVFGANGLIIRKQFWGQWLSTRKTLNSIVAKTFVSRKEQALKPCLICYLLCGWYFLSVYLIWIIPHNCKIILR